MSKAFHSLLATHLFIAVFLLSIVPAQCKNTNEQQLPQTLSLNIGGRLICDLDYEVTVATPLGSIRCAPKATVFIFRNERALTVFDFDSNKQGDVQFIGNRTKFTLRPAEQLVVTELTVSKFDKINPGLGIIHKQGKPVDLGSGLTAYVAEFSLASGVQRIPILRQLASSKKPSEKRALQRILKNAAILQSSAERLLQKQLMPPGMMAATPDTLPPGQMLKGSVERFGQGSKQCIDMRIAQCRRSGFARVSGMTWVELVDNDWKLKDTRKESNNPYEVAGLLTCPVDTIIKTELGYIDCKKGSTVFIVNKESSVAVCTLDSPHVDDVNIRMPNQPPLRLSPGRQILLTQDLENSFDKVNPTHQIGYRDEKEVGTVNGIKIVRADFSLAAAMMSVEPLRRLATSKDSEENRLAQSIVKNSVILWGLTANHGVFHPPK